MKRTTVYLEELTDLKLSRLARLNNRSKAELIREALDKYVEAAQEASPVPSWVGAGRSGMPDLAERDEELLGELYEEDYARIMADWKALKKGQGS